jgi:membrane protein DedA with SNARE-associated domain
MVVFLLRHGYIVLFAVALAEQLGTPLPSSPLLITAGALAKSGKLGLAQVLLLTVTASVLGHSVWFFAGRARGGSVLRLLCRISIEPDSCVRRTEDVFARHGARALVAAPWIPGLAVIAPPLAGMSGMSFGRFIALDAAGAVLWGGAFALLGYLLGPQLLELVQVALRFGSWFALVVGIALGLWLAWKIAQRHWLLRSLAMPRAEPEELAARLEASDAPLVVDLRHELDLKSGIASVPGAVLVGFEELADWCKGLPREREIILTCD